MKPSQVICLLLLSIGKIKMTIANYGHQPVDAVLLIDGAPTYLRLTNSTSLEAVYSCILQNSQNVNSVIMSSQIKGVEMNVGQIEEDVNEIIRLLSSEARSKGRMLWKSPEELKLFKMRLAHYLTKNYYDNKTNIDMEMYKNLKSQRNTDWVYKNRGSNFYRTHPNWREQMHESRRQFPVLPSNFPYLVTPGPYKSPGISPNYFVLTPSAVSVSDKTIFPDATVMPSNSHNVIKTENPAPVVITERYMTSDSSSIGKLESSIVIPSLNEKNTSEPEVRPLMWIYETHDETLPFLYDGKFESEITKMVKEPETSTYSVEGFSNMDKSKTHGMSLPTTDFVESYEKYTEKKDINLSKVTAKKFETTKIVATTPATRRNPIDNFNQMRNSSEAKSSEESSTEKVKKSKYRRKNGRKRVVKSLQ